MSEIPSQRRTRVYLACVNCRGRKIKCLTDDSEETPCKRCVKMGLVCQYIPVPVQQAHSTPASPIGRPHSSIQPVSLPAASRPDSVAGNQQAIHERHPQSVRQNYNTMGYTPLETFDRSSALNRQFGGQNTRAPSHAYNAQGPYHTAPTVPAQQQYPKELASALNRPFEGYQQGYTTMTPNYTVPGPSVQQQGQQSAPDWSGYPRSSTRQHAYTPDNAIVPGVGDNSS